MMRSDFIADGSKEITASKEHQQLVNALLRKLEMRGVIITHVDIAGSPQYFDKKYRSLPTPPWYGNHSPDLQGIKDGQIYLGEAEMDLSNPSVDEHITIFSNVIIKQAKSSVLFHIIVPKNLKEDIHEKIKKLGLDSKVQSGQITVWF